jgi:hypothetical protein
MQELSMKGFALPMRLGEKYIGRLLRQPLAK